MSDPVRRRPLRALTHPATGLMVLAALMVMVIASLATPGCGTVDIGAYEGVRDLKLDEGYYYCVVQPEVITAKRCSTGESTDPAGGCHGNATAMRLKEVIKPVACSGSRPTGPASREERENFGAAQLRALRDIEASPIIARPTQKANHPRLIFTSDSREANLLRTWIKGGT